MNQLTMRVWRRAAVLLSLAAAALLGGCAAGPSAPSDITLAGVVVDSERLAGTGEYGLVRIERGGSVIEGRAGMVLQPGDAVATGPTASAVIRYPSGTELYLRPDTRGRVGSFTEMIGEVFAKIRGAFAIQTTFVRAGAEGTAYSVRATPAGDYTLVVFDGTVRLSSLREAWPAVAVGAGAMSTGRPQMPPRTLRASPDELARTRAWVERLESLVPAPSTGSGIGPALAIAGIVAILAASQSGGGDTGLAAPTGLSPAGPTPQAPAAASGCYPLTLTWHAVRGAHDYQVILQPQAAARTSSATSAPMTTVAPTLSLPRVASGLYRWQVHARDNAGKAGPDSAPGYFRCP